MQQETVSDELQKVYDYESKMIPPYEALIIVGIWVIVILASFMKGGKGLDSIIGIEQCSDEY